jgi:4'-phosphopantetheinyl transferase
VNGTDVSLWSQHTAGLSPVDVEQMTGILSVDERHRWRRFVFDRDRRDFAAAHTLLRRALSSCDDTPPEDWRFVTDARGKPHLDPQHSRVAPLTFNLSHTNGLVACTVARHAQVGVDVERIGRVGAPGVVAARMFAASEIAFLEACAPADYAAQFTELWTLKEAYVKALGTGLDMPLDSFAFAFEGVSGLRITTPAGSGHWQFLLAAPSADTRLALAVRSAEAVSGWRVSVRSACAGEGVPRVLRCSPALAVARGALHCRDDRRDR